MYTGVNLPKILGALGLEISCNLWHHARFWCYVMCMK